MDSVAMAGTETIGGRNGASCSILYGKTLRA